MAKLAKKEIRKIEQISIFTDIIKKHYPEDIADKHWIECPPDMWERDQARMFDMMGELEMKLKQEVLKIVNESK